MKAYIHAKAWVIGLSLAGNAALVGPVPARAEIGIWTSAAELASLPTSGAAWQAVLSAANSSASSPDVTNQEDPTNVHVLAAGIVYARTGNIAYRDKVVAACELLSSQGNPGGRTLAWAREVGAYALAADLAGYRTQAFEAWLRDMADRYVASDGRTLRGMFEDRPNNWGSHGFGSLCAIYRYLGDTASLTRIRDYWVRGVTGSNPGFSYGDESWQFDPHDLRLINPRGATKQGMDIDGVIPDDQRRGGTFANPPGATIYPWEFMQGQIMAARILERAGNSIWQVGDRALYRAAYCLQVRFANAYGASWAAAGDDAWMLPFLDEAYGTRWSRGQSRLWDAGKNAGFGYVTGSTSPPTTQVTLTVTITGGGAVTLDPPGGRYSAGTLVTLTAKPAAGWMLGSLIG
jgi:hypothetical protein